MGDVTKQIAYWREGSNEDWEVAQELLGKGRTRHALFMAHLAIEKALKAHVCRHSKEPAPKMHALLRLAKRTGLDLDVEREAFFAEFDRFQVEGRYPETLEPPLSRQEAGLQMARAKGVWEWLILRLSA